MVVACVLLKKMKKVLNAVATTITVRPHGILAPTLPTPAEQSPADLGADLLGRPLP